MQPDILIVPVIVTMALSGFGSAVTVAAQSREDTIAVRNAVVDQSRDLLRNEMPAVFDGRIRTVGKGMTVAARNFDNQQALANRLGIPLASGESGLRCDSAGRCRAPEGVMVLSMTEVQFRGDTAAVTVMATVGSSTGAPDGEARTFTLVRREPLSWDVIRTRVAVP